MKVQKKNKIELTNAHPEISLSLERYRDMICRVIHREKISLRSLHIITVGDEYLKELHKQFLHKDSFTDVLTFHLDEEGQREGEIYISLDQAKLNANEYGVELSEEIARLIIHGLLHLKGYDDAEHAGKQQMHQLENEYLQRFWSV
jgi:probable rRNA maturation factor